MITWTFEGMEISFRSTPENFERDILKMAKANKIDPETKTRIIDGSTNNTLPTDAASSDGDTSDLSQSTLPVDTKKTKTRKSETNELPTVPGDMDDDTSMPTPMEPTGDDGNTSWSGDWFDSQRV